MMELFSRFYNWFDYFEENCCYSFILIVSILAICAGIEIYSRVVEDESFFF